ncbi:hypothetical protein DS901_00665 [Loktanella sp. D2R18]|uniref:Hint domain-containing protein n=1 Tax=Rhodobacterales TaxID=204455 RepID=UPI000DE859A4|nr:MULTISPECIES: Hint domain-containing protein [Rhodobacterales]MDO6591308.1 Hint domain-containing protein [Yoonia sp. 1_MG-2023]RBW46260.1 hypothetical protein DS901_00665 [Loktanella sp. D2R18]
MPVETVYTLEASNITISNGAQLSGLTQGDGSHLIGETITLDNNDWQTVDVFDSDGNFQDSSDTQSLSGAQVYDGVPYADGLRVEAEYTLLVEDSTGTQYTLVAFNINEVGVASFATVEGLAFVGGVGGFPPIGEPLTVISAQEGPSVPYTTLASPPCFTRGCMISTPKGTIAVEDICAGDLVDTLDSGPQKVRWVGRARLPRAALVKNPKFLPVLIKQDAIGAGQPSRDIYLSPQHRVLVTGWRAELLFGEAEILVPAAKLANDHSVIADEMSGDIEYFHIMFDHHEIVCSDGLWSESYLPGVAETGAIETERELEALFPELSKNDVKKVSARVCISDKRTAILNA